LQSFCALLHELWPLQELAPTHFTLAAIAPDPLDGAAAGSWAIAAEAKNSVATAEARIAPFVPLFIVSLHFPLSGIVLIAGRPRDPQNCGRKRRFWPTTGYSLLLAESYTRRGPADWRSSGNFS
jgi:hypothetical protein